MPPPLHFQVRAVSCLNPRHMNRAADALRQYSLSPPETSAATPIFGARPVFRKTGEMVAKKVPGKFGTAEVRYELADAPLWHL